VVDSDVQLYVSLRDLRSNKFYELREDTLPPEELHYQWARGPAVPCCVFHPHKTAVIHDTSKTFQYYCSRECFLRGWRHLPKNMWLPT